VFSGIIGGIASYFILKLEGRGGMHGWQWLFLIEGLPAVIIGVCAWFVLPNKPANAHWLTPNDRKLLSDHVAHGNAAHHQQHHGHADHDSTAFVHHASSVQVSSTYVEASSSAIDQPPVQSDDGFAPRLSWSERWHRIRQTTAFRTLTFKLVWLFSFANFFTMIPISILSFYLPSVIQHLGLGKGLDSNLFSTLPYSLAALVMYVNSRHSDSTKERFRHILFVTLIGVPAFLMLSLLSNPALQLLMACVGAACMWGSKPILFAWMSYAMPGSKAVGIALVIAVGNCGGLLGPPIMGWFMTHTGSYSGGILIVALCEGIFAFFIVLINREVNRGSFAFEAAPVQSEEVPLELGSVRHTGVVAAAGPGIAAEDRRSFGVADDDGLRLEPSNDDALSGDVDPQDTLYPD